MADAVVLTQGSARIYFYRALNYTAGSQLGVAFNDAVGANLHCGVEAGAAVNDGGGMDIVHGQVLFVLVTEVAHAGKDHCDVGFICCCDNLFIAH